MKLDYDLVREILEGVEERGDGFEEHQITRDDFADDDEGKQKFLAFAYHFKHITDSEFIDGRILEARTFGGGSKPDILYYKGLTPQGVKTLEAMQNDTIWNSIKGSTIKLGKKGLIQIPSLAVTALMLLVGEE